MPTLFTAQNGATIKQNTPISITGCKKAVRKHKKRKTKRGKRVRSQRRKTAVRL